MSSVDSEKVFGLIINVYFELITSHKQCFKIFDMTYETTCIHMEMMCFLWHLNNQVTADAWRVSQEGLLMSTNFPIVPTYNSEQTL